MPSNTGLILGILSFLVVLYLDVESDYKRLASNTINHKRGLILRCLGMLFPLGCFVFPLESLRFWHIFLKVFIASGMLASVWWELFDGWLNLKRGKSWRYNGSDDPNDATTDNILQKYKPWQQMLIKWGLIFVFISLYLLIF